MDSHHRFTKSNFSSATRPTPLRRLIAGISARLLQSSQGIEHGGGSDTSQRDLCLSMQGVFGNSEEGPRLPSLGVPRKTRRLRDCGMGEVTHAALHGSHILEGWKTPFLSEPVQAYAAMWLPESTRRRLSAHRMNRRELLAGTVRMSSNKVARLA